MISRKEFIGKIIEELTEGGVIPASPKEDRISSIIDTTKSYFYEHDDNSHEFQYIIVEKSAFRTPLFVEKRQIRIPDEVHAIMRFRTLSNAFRYDYANNPDFRKNSWNFSLGISGDSRALLTSISVNSYNSFLEKFIVEDIRYEFSNYTHMLTVSGRNVFENAVMETSFKIPENGLFEQDRFFRYCIGKCKMSFANIIGFTGQKLIGNYAIDLNFIRSEGKELISDAIKEMNDEKSGDFMTFFD